MIRAGWRCARRPAPPEAPGGPRGALGRLLLLRRGSSGFPVQLQLRVPLGAAPPRLLGGSAAPPAGLSSAACRGSRSLGPRSSAGEARPGDERSESELRWPLRQGGHVWSGRSTAARQLGPASSGSGAAEQAGGRAVLLRGPGPSPGAPGDRWGTAGTGLWSAELHRSVCL